MYIDLHAKCLFSFPILMKLEFPRQFFEKYSNIKFHGNPSSGSRVVPSGQTDARTDGQADRRTGMAKLVVAVRNFANAPSKEYVVSLFAVHCLFQDRRGGKISHTLPLYYNQLIYTQPLFTPFLF
jgi:hypothetical protein